jgi:hypothetical protein
VYCVQVIEVCLPSPYASRRVGEQEIALPLQPTEIGREWPYLNRFAPIVIDGKKYRRDVIIYPDGMVEKRKGGIWMFGSHSFKKEEVEELKGAEVAVIGLGTSARAHLSGAAKDYAQESNLELLLLPSYEAVSKLNQLIEQGKRAAAIFHITC